GGTGDASGRKRKWPSSRSARRPKNCGRSQDASRKIIIHSAQSQACSCHGETVTAPTKAVIARSVEIMRDLRERYPRSAAGKIHPNNFVKLAERLAWEGIVHPDDI